MSESPNWSNPLRDSRGPQTAPYRRPMQLVIFGVTGDLAQKKLLPAVYDLANRGYCAELRSDRFRPPRLDTGTVHRIRQGRRPGALPYAFKESTWRNLAAGIRFVQGTFDDPEAFERLSAPCRSLTATAARKG